MNPDKPEDRRRLMTAVDHHRWKLAPLRVARRELLKRASGSEWYPNGADEDTPINQIAQAENVLLQHLAGGDPQALVLAGHPSSERSAYEQSLALNKLSEQLGFRQKLHRLIRDAIYGIGICRVGMTLDRHVPVRELIPESEQEDLIAVGKIFLQVVSLECWVHDTIADTVEQFDFCGNAYCVRADELAELLPGVRVEDLHEDEKRLVDEQGDETAGAISRGTEGQGQEEFEKRYWLWDLWLPRERVIVTTQVNGTGEIANVRPWEARPGGPYLFLSYREVPDQAMPKSILADLKLVHDSLNSTFRKLIEQTRDQKTVLGFKPGHEDDAARIRDAGSRATIQMRDPTAVREFNFNGPSAEMLTMLLQTRELASIIGGNTDVLGGIGPQAETLGQEQLIHGTAGAKVQSLEFETARFTVQMFEAVRWYLYHEQREPIRFTKELAATGDRIPAQFSSYDAQGDFDEYAMQIEPYSLVYRSPEQRLRMILELWQGIIMPAVQMDMIQQAPDMDKLLEIIARYSNLPELKSILRYLDPNDVAQAQSPGAEPRQSPVTTRNYVRHGAPGPNQGGQAAMMLQGMMAGGGSQQSGQGGLG